MKKRNVAALIKNKILFLGDLQGDLLDLNL